MTVTDLLNAVEELKPVVEANWMKMEKQRALPVELVDALARPNC